jgi:hypothetical protein
LAVVAPAPRRRHGRVRDLAPPRLRVAAGIVALVPFLVHAWVALHGYFGQDDFVITYRAAHADPLDFAYLLQDYNGHLAPGTFLIAWLQTAIAPLNYAVASVPLMVMHGLALWLFWLVLVRLFGYRWSLLPAFAVLSASPLILFPTLWWAYGMQLLPLLATMAAALLAHLRYLETGASRYAVHALAWTGCGMLFYEKAALFGGILFAVTVLQGNTVSATLVRHWRVWTAHGTILVCYAILYFGLTASQTGTEPVSATQIAEYTRIAVVDTFLPGLFGGPFTEATNSIWTTPSLVFRIVAVTVTVGLIVLSRRTAPWLFLAGYLAVDLVLVAVTRLSLVGPIIGADPRYLADAVPVAVLCAAFALRGRAPDRRVPMVAVATVLTAASVISFLQVAPALQFRQAREYVATARAAFAEQPHIVLYDTTVPNDVILEWFIVDNFSSRVVGLLPETPEFDRPAEELYQLDGTGRPQQITELTDSVRGERGPAPDCGHLIKVGPVNIPLTSASGGRRVMRLGYYTGDTGDGVITVGDTTVPVRFRKGLHVLYVVVTGTYTHVAVTWNRDLAPLCVTDVEIGLPKR